MLINSRINNPLSRRDLLKIAEAAGAAFLIGCSGVESGIDPLVAQKEREKKLIEYRGMREVAALKQVLLGKTVIVPDRLSFYVDDLIGRRVAPGATEKPIPKNPDLGNGGYIEVIHNPVIVMGDSTDTIRSSNDPWILAYNDRLPDEQGQGGFEFIAYSPETAGIRGKRRILVMEAGREIIPTIDPNTGSYPVNGKVYMVEDISPSSTSDTFLKPVIIGRDLIPRRFEFLFPKLVSYIEKINLARWIREHPQETDLNEFMRQLVNEP